MKADLFIKTSLIIIIALLALNIILPILSNPSASYAAKNIEYKIIELGPKQQDAAQTEILFNEFGKEGWEFIQIDTVYALVIFKR
jgi:uncharacterized membrane protein YjgN (DUF898 family)